MKISDEKGIETPELLIKGNIMSWEETMIQLSNVSCISTRPIELLKFPTMSIVVLLLGLVILKVQVLIALILLAVGAAWIYYWYYSNNKRKDGTILSIIMNSGNNLQFLFNSKDFLNSVLRVLEAIIIEGGVGDKNVSIDIRGCQITGNAHVLENLKIL